MIRATISEARTNLSELLKRAQEGETVMITSGWDKTPVAMGWRPSTRLGRSGLGLSRRLDSS